MMRTALPLAACVAAGLWSVPEPLLAYALPKEPALKVAGLRTEYKENPLGIDARKPRLGWRLQSGSRGLTQSAYEVRVARTESGVRSGRDLVWSSGRV